MKYGKIGKLKVNVSYRNFSSQPAEALIEDVFVLLGPFEENKYDPKRYEEIEASYKRKMLYETEKLEDSQVFGRNFDVNLVVKNF